MSPNKSLSAEYICSGASGSVAVMHSPSFYLSFTLYWQELNKLELYRFAEITSDVITENAVIDH
jgi:hypothetical protein